MSSSKFLSPLTIVIIVSNRTCYPRASSPSLSSSFPFFVAFTPISDLRLLRLKKPFNAVIMNARPRLIPTLKARQWSGRDRSPVHPGYAPPRQCEWNGSRDCRAGREKNLWALSRCLPRGADSTNKTDERPMENVDQWRSGDEGEPGAQFNLTHRCSPMFLVNEDEQGHFSLPSPFHPLAPTFFTLSLPWTRYNLADIVPSMRDVPFRGTAIFHFLN